jgi:uncharacterized protein YidB (DUF937 family)
VLRAYRFYEFTVFKAMLVTLIYKRRLALLTYASMINITVATGTAVHTTAMTQVETGCNTTRSAPININRNFQQERDIMDLMKLGTQLLASKLGSGADSGAITGALGGLLSGGGGQTGLDGIIAAMQGKGLGSIAESWLGDGDNEDISTEQVREVVGNDRITEMASQLNTDESSLLDGLKDALPQIIDKSSSGGSLLDSAGGLLGMAKKFL